MITAIYPPFRLILGESELEIDYKPSRSCERPEDGEIKQTEINLDYCTDINQATQLAALELVNSREFLNYTVLCKPRLLQVRTGQTVTIASAGLNIAAQKCLVVGREIDLATFCVRLKLRSEDDEKYDWIQGLSPTAPDTKTLVGIDWATPGAPDADIFTVASFVDDDQIPAFLISGNVGDIPDAISTIRFDYKLSSASDWTFDGAFSVNDYDNISYAIRGLKPVTYYDIAISYVNSFGVVTDRTVFSNKLTSKLISNDTQNVGGVNAGDLVNTATQAYSLGWDAVNNAAILAAQMTANFVAVANALTAEANTRANAVAALASNFTATANSLQANIDALESQIDEASLAPSWSNAVNYTIGEIVTDNGSLWKAIANGVNHEPPSSYWDLIGQYDSISGAVDGLASQVNLTNANVVTLGNTVTLTATDMTGVKARLTNAETKANTAASAITALQANSLTQGNTIASQANAITAVQSNVSALASNVAGQSTAISALQSNSIAQGSNITSQAASITALTSNVAALNAANSVQATAISGLQTLTSQQGSNITSQAASITALNSNVATLISANAAQSTAIGALQTLTTAQGSNISTQAGQITSLQSNVGALVAANAAQSTAIGALQTLTTQQGSNISTQAGQITSLQSNVGALIAANAAQSTAIGALQTLTTAQGSNITTQAASITSLQSQINDSGGDNLIYNPSFESGTATVSAEGWSVAGTYTSAVVQNNVSYDGNQGKSQRINATGLTTTVYADLKTATGVEAQVTAGKTYTLSAYVNATASIFQHRMYIQYRNSAGTVLTTAQTALVTSSGWQRLSLSATAPSGTVDAVIYLRTFGATTTASTAGTIYWDMVQLELGSMTAFRDNIRASTSAISGLQTSVTALGSNVTATATSLTTLTASLGDTGGQNLFYNPSFSGSGTVADGWSSVVSGGGSGSVTNTLPASSRTAGATMQRQAVSGLSASIYSNLYTSSTTNFAPVVYGQTYTMSVWVIATAGLSIRPYIFWHDSSGTAINNNGVTVTATGSWQQITVTATNANNTQVYARPQLRVYSGTVSAGSVYWDSIQLEQGSYATAWRDNPSATISSLQTVTASQASDIASLSARASLTVSAGGAVTGFDITANAAQGSTFAIQADKFVLTSGTKSVSPFSVDVTNSVVTCTNLVVDTLQIKQGALTNYGYYQNAVAYNVDTASEVTFGSVTITTSGGWVDLAASIVGYSGLSSGYTYYDMKLYRDSTQLISVPRSLCLFTYPGIPSQGASGIYVDTPAAGTYTYSWRGIVSSYSSGRSTNITYRSLRAVEFKR